VKLGREKYLTNSTVQRGVAGQRIRERMVAWKVEQKGWRKEMMLAGWSAESRVRWWVDKMAVTLVALKAALWVGSMGELMVAKLDEQMAEMLDGLWVAAMAQMLVDWKVEGMGGNSVVKSGERLDSAWVAVLESRKAGKQEGRLLGWLEAAPEGSEVGSDDGWELGGKEGTDDRAVNWLKTARMVGWAWVSLG
jgi:hypothetical protein